MNATKDVNIYDIFGFCYGLKEQEAYDRGLKVIHGNLISHKKSFFSQGLHSMAL